MMSRRLERLPAYGAAFAACALLVAPVPAAPLQGFGWTGVCTAHGVIRRPAGKNHEQPNKDTIAACHAGCALPRKGGLSGRCPRRSLAGVRLGAGFGRRDRAPEA